MAKKKKYKSWLNTYEDGGKDDPGMRGMMKARMAYASQFGNPSAQRMTSPNPKTFNFDDGSTGTHFMGSFGNEARPHLQDTGGKNLEYIKNPKHGSPENIKFETPEDANYFSKHYKDVAPMMRNKEFKKGGKTSWLDTYEPTPKFSGGGEIDPLNQQASWESMVAKSSNPDQTNLTNKPGANAQIPYGMIGQVAGGIVNTVAEDDPLKKGYIGGKVGASALKGAGMGASFGPWGAAIGAGVGAIGGGLQAVADRKDAQQDVDDANWAKQQQVREDRPDFFKAGGKTNKKIKIKKTKSWLVNY